MLCIFFAAAHYAGQLNNAKLVGLPPNFEPPAPENEPHNAKLVGLPPRLHSTEERQSHVRADLLHEKAVRTAKHDLRKTFRIAEQAAERMGIKDAVSTTAAFRHQDNAEVTKEETAAAKTILMSEVTKMVQDADAEHKDVVPHYNKLEQEYSVLSKATHSLEQKAWQAKAPKQQSLYILAARLLKQWALKEKKQLGKAQAALKETHSIDKQLRQEVSLWCMLVRCWLIRKMLLSTSRQN